MQSWAHDTGARGEAGFDASARCCATDVLSRIADLWRQGSYLLCMCQAKWPPLINNCLVHSYPYFISSLASVLHLLHAPGLPDVIPQVFSTLDWALWKAAGVAAQEQCPAWDSQRSLRTSTHRLYKENVPGLKWDRDSGLIWSCQNSNRPHTMSIFSTLWNVEPWSLQENS